MKYLIILILVIPVFLSSQNTGIYINSSGQVAVGKESASQPFQVFVDTGNVADVLDQQSAEMGNTSGILITSTVSDGQSITCGLSGELLSISLRMGTANPAATSNLVLNLRTGSSPTGAIVDTKSFNIEGDAFKWYDVILYPGTMVNPGDPFFIEIIKSGGDNAVWDWVDGTNPYPVGSSWQNGGSWFEIVNSDLVFRTYVRTVDKSEILSVTSDADVKINNYIMPKQDGASNQVHTTDGAGNLNWKQMAGSSSPFTNPGNGDGSTCCYDRATSSQGGDYDSFGTSVSISGNYCIVGAYNEDVGSNMNQGAAYIFFRSGNSWIEQARITAGDGTASDFFGLSVSISGDYALVGASGHDTGGSFDRGAAYIFKRTGTTWTQEAKIVASDGVIVDRFGSVSIHNDYAIVGVSGHDTGGSINRGAAYIFKRTGTAWAQEAKLIATDGIANDRFGSSVSIHNDYAIVGAPTNISDGAAYVFKRTGSSWGEEAKLIGNGIADNRFGYSVDIYNNKVVVGEYGNGGNGLESGAAYIFVRNGTSWSQESIFLAPDGAAGDRFGWAVSIDNDYCLIGSPDKDYSPDCGTTTVHLQGKAYLYRYSNGMWNLHSSILDPVVSELNSLGSAISIDNLSFVIAAPYADVNGNTQQGKVIFGKAIE